MSGHDKRLRDEFEEWFSEHLPDYDHAPQGWAPKMLMLLGFEAAHAKYASRWLTIGEEVKDGNPLLGLRVQDDAVCLAYWNDGSFYNVWTGEKVILTHYLPIPGAPEVAA